MAYHKVEIEFNGQPLTIETGKMARQADGATVITYGETKVLCTAVSAKKMREGQGFFPLTVNYQEKFYAAGKIPGSFFRRERGSTERETLICRLIDRPMRPLFPKGYMFETQIMPTVISADLVNDPDTLAMVAASAAVVVSDIPFAGPIAAVRVGRVDGQLIANPTLEQIAQSDLEIVVSGSRDAVMMVEGEADLISEDEMLEAIFFGHNALQPLIDMQLKLQELVGVAKREFLVAQTDPELEARVKELAAERLAQAATIRAKQERYGTIDLIKAEVQDTLAEEFEGRSEEIGAILGSISKKVLRQMVTKEKVRIDGRDMTTVRPISCEVGVLPRAHGSALFTRGETQALVATTLGTSGDEQRMDNIQGMEFKKFLLHYNFPPFSVGETSMRLFPGRREIGHGMLAERSVTKILPKHDDFPYTIRIVSDVLESNGSSSMASVCGASLSLMDAGAPVKEAVAGIAMGLIKEGDDVAILSDILGDEDHLGDMDFKVTGTADGVAALANGHQDHRRRQGDHEAGPGPGPGGAPAHSRRDGQGNNRAACGTLPVCTADHHHLRQARPGAHRHRLRRQEHPRHHRGHRLHHRHRGRWAGQHRLGRWRCLQEGDQDDPRPDPGGRGRQAVHGDGAQDHGIRRLRRDLPRYRRPGPRL